MRCGVFLGPRCRKHGLIFISCYACKGFVCVDCSAPLFHPDHACVVTDEVAAKALETTLLPQVRGKDYQICPNSDCLRPVALWDGCNAVMCLCGQTLCFLCGVAASPEDGHWEEGRKCPRFGPAVDGEAAKGAEQRVTHEGDEREEGERQDGEGERADIAGRTGLFEWLERIRRAVE